MKLGVFGCAGKMGRDILRLAFDDEEISVVGGTVTKTSQYVGQDLGVLAGMKEQDLYAHTNPEELIKKSELLIDFTSPKSSLSFVELCLEHNKPMVIGSTGFSKEEKDVVLEAGKRLPIVFSPNMSIGVTVLKMLVEKAANLLDERFDIDVFEVHHRHKKDAPSGTALFLAKAAARGRGKQKRDYFMTPPSSREPGEIGMSCIRGGEGVFEHSVLFLGNGETLTLGHSASTRRIFSEGAIRAAKWLMDKPAGIYGMADVLALK